MALDIAMLLSKPLAGSTITPDDEGTGDPRFQMNPLFFLGQSLQARAIVFMLAVLITSIWSLALYADRLAHVDMERLSSEQQLSTVSLIATEIDQELRDRRESLEALAKKITPKMMSDAAALRALLANSPGLVTLFNAGNVIFNTESVAIADFPEMPGRAGRSYPQLSIVRTALDEGRSSFGKPIQSNTSAPGNPIIGFGVPIRDELGKVIGLVAGVTNLGKVNFMSRITDSRYGRTGNYLLVAPTHHLIVTASDKRYVMKEISELGNSPLIERFNRGDEGSGTYVDPDGVEMLASARRVPASNWYVAVVLPTDDAFAPIHELRQQVLLAAILVTLLAGGLTWWLLRRQLAPMLATIQTLARLSDTKQRPKALPIARQDEIGRLIGGFNRLLETLAKGEEALRESEARYRALVEWLPDAVAVHRNGKLVYVNPALVRTLGAASAQDLLGKPYLDLIHPDFHETVMERSQRYIEKGAAAPAIEERLLKLDGTTVIAEVRSSPINFDGEQAVLVAIQDITDRKQIEAERASLEAQLRESQKMEAIGTLAGGIAHDFNNALATILGNAELAREDMGQHAKALESLDEIRKAAVRTRDLVQQILAFSRRQPIARAPLALETIIEESVRMLRATLPSRVTLEVWCDADVPPVMADASQIQQVLINLANNAAQATRGAPGRICIRLDTVTLDGALADTHPELRTLFRKRPGRTVRLAVSDNGRGMDAATLGRIFEPFFTTKPAGEGTGLGLSIVHGVMRGHQGAIVVASQPGEGATFTLYFPTADVPTNVPFPETAAADPEPVMGGGQHILYLDDDESLVFLVERLLQRRGFRVSGYTCQDEALSALRGSPEAYDLVVSDYNMPSMSGLEVAREVHAICAVLPVALASGFIDEELRTLAASAGVRQLIFKADAAEGLCDAIARLAQIVAEERRATIHALT